MLNQVTRKGGEPEKDKSAPKLGSNKEAVDAAAKGREALKRLKESETQQKRSRRDCCDCCR